MCIPNSPSYTPRINKTQILLHKLEEKSERKDSQKFDVDRKSRPSFDHLHVIHINSTHPHWSTFSQAKQRRNFSFSLTVWGLLSFHPFFPSSVWAYKFSPALISLTSLFDVFLCCCGRKREECGRKSVKCVQLWIFFELLLYVYQSFMVRVNSCRPAMGLSLSLLCVWPAFVVARRKSWENVLLLRSIKASARAKKTGVGRNVKFVVYVPVCIIELKCFFDISGGPPWLLCVAKLHSSSSSLYDDMMGIIKIQLGLLRWQRRVRESTNQFTLNEEGCGIYKKNVMKIVVIVHRMSMTVGERIGWGDSRLSGNRYFCVTFLMSDKLMSTNERGGVRGESGWGRGKVCRLLRLLPDSCSALWHRWW